MAKKTKSQKIWGKHYKARSICRLAGVAAFDQEIAYNIQQIALQLALYSDDDRAYDRYLDNISEVVGWAIRDLKDKRERAEVSGETCQCR